MGDPLGRDAHQPGQLLEGDPGPVGDEVEGALLYGLEQDRQHVVGDVPARTLYREVGGRVGPLRLRLYWKLSARPRPVEGVAQVDLGADLWRAPYPVARPRQDRKAFHGEQGRNVSGGEEPSGVPEPHRVGHEYQHRSGHSPVAQPPEPPREARPVGGEPLPEDADGPAVGQRHGGVEGDGAVPAEPDGERQAGDGGGDAVDGGLGVEALHQAAPPLRGDGTGAHQLVEGHALLVREPAQPGGGEMEPPGRGKHPRRMGHGGAEPAGHQLFDGLVDRAPGPAGDGDHLQPVEEGHPRQRAEQVGLTSFGSHSWASSALPLRLLRRLLRSGSASGFRRCAPSPSRSSTPLRNSSTFRSPSASP